MEEGGLSVFVLEGDEALECCGRWVGGWVGWVEEDEETVWMRKPYWWEVRWVGWWEVYLTGGGIGRERDASFAVAGPG